MENLKVCTMQSLSKLKLVKLVEKGDLLKQDIQEDITILN